MTNRQTHKEGEIHYYDSKGEWIKTETGWEVGRGDNKTIINPDDVERLAIVGMTNQEISDYFNISYSSVDYNFSDILTKGRAQLKERLRQAQLKYALKGNPTLLIWLGKNLLGQTEQGEKGNSDVYLPWGNDVPDELKEKQDANDPASNNSNNG